MAKVQVCPYADRDDCFGRQDGLDGEPGKHCYVLIKTKFKNHDCPFYKTRDEFKKGLEIYGGFKPYSG